MAGNAAPDSIAAASTRRTSVAVASGARRRAPARSRIHRERPAPPAPIPGGSRRRPSRSRVCADAAIAPPARRSRAGSAGRRRRFGPPRRARETARARAPAWVRPVELDKSFAAAAEARAGAGGSHDGADDHAGSSRLGRPFERRPSIPAGSAKIIRPAEVWITDVTVAVDRLVQQAAAVLDHHHCSVVKASPRPALALFPRARRSRRSPHRGSPPGASPAPVRSGSAPRCLRGARCGSG